MSPRTTALPFPILLIDGYKLDHRRQYPAGTLRVYSNMTPRSSRVPGQTEVVLFGLQYFLQRYLIDEMGQWFFDRPRDEVVGRYARRVDSYLGPNDVGTDHIAALHDLGYIPLQFRALPEGTLCPLRVPMLTVENTHPDFAWLVNYVETLMSNVLWMPCTSATNAYRLRLMLNRGAARTGADLSFVQWQGHDFSFRGMGGVEAACLSGMAHLLSFTGTDTMPALDYVDAYYPGDNGLVGASVAATEHSVMSAGGAHDERGTVSRVLKLYPRGIVSIVSDTWDLWHMLVSIIPSLRDVIMEREGKLVIRPDSGDPLLIICGDPGAPYGTPRHKGVIQLLWETFGGTVTATGHRVLDPHIGAIYGDAINYDRAEAICNRLAELNFASTNVVLGVGSFTYQYVTRDTYGFAVKATWALVNGEGRDLFKKPVTDTGEKFSAKGRIAVQRDERGRLVMRDGLANPVASLLDLVWIDGNFIRRQSFADVRRMLWGG